MKHFTSNPAHKCSEGRLYINNTGNGDLEPCLFSTGITLIKGIIAEQPDQREPSAGARGVNSNTLTPSNCPSSCTSCVLRWSLPANRESRKAGQTPWPESSDGAGAACCGKREPSRIASSLGIRGSGDTGTLSL